jgi:class 3 adenylate cyclase
MASAEAMMALSVCCDMMFSKNTAKRPVCIASRHNNFLNLDPYRMNGGGSGVELPTSALQPYESLRMHCKSLNQAALARLHLQMALYVHPVIRSDELALSAAIQAGKISKPTETMETRHRAEAELRSVFTIFIKAIMSPKITGVAEVDEELYKKLADVMHVTSRELDRYSGHLRQFIVDDKGVVLIATFGLRGSTFPNMVSNNGLPAVFAIHRALKTELSVENRIGATFGKVYCGVVGGVRRHEFAVMGAPVNLAARLMGSKVNNGILVDEAVRAQSDARFIFKSLPPVQAKGYDKPVPILEPEKASGTTKKKRSTFPFTGRKEEKKVVMSAVNVTLQDPSNPSTMIFLMGESGMGKTALAVSILEDIKKHDWQGEKKTIVTARSTSTEMEQRIPLR